MSDLDLPDVNVLIALLHRGHVHHSCAQAWFGRTASFATTPITEGGFLRLALNPAVAGGSVSIGAALASLRSLRADPRAVFVPDDSTLAEAAISVDSLAGHRQVTDFQLLNLAVLHDARLVTFDRRIASTVTGLAATAVHTL